MIITLTTDWGTTDFYLPLLKGEILSALPEVRLVDITHDIPRYDYIKTAFVLANSFHHFPKGTVHLIGVGSVPEAHSKYLAVLYRGHYFIGTDNGIFSLIMEDEKVTIVELGEQVNSSFPMLDIFMKPALALASGSPLSSLGKTRDGLIRSVMTKPSYDSNLLNGNIVYMDAFDNAITNISRQIFDEVGKGRPFTLYMRKFTYNITTISKNYNDVDRGDMMAFFNTLNLLEIGINRGNAGGLMGLKYRDPIRIEFHD